ncbi:MAG: T9SS type A sorting domain-containing protein [Flavobacteriales bacterium]|nr:T9SS type A sorting domain-containing protein [Flavobacteriales bacterium]MBP6697210.1 T9SS type A sorting domain-containing protein [Flavobacteriales bacterium]
MKKSLLIAALFATTGAMAQLPSGSVCPDFTGTDLNGVTHNLYDYLDQGYTVVVDVSATWCGPCWNYHNTGSLEDLYNQYGPGTAEDKVIVIFVEGDGSTTLADLQGTTGATQGNWISGTPYPIIDDASIANLLDISYFPTIYTICPNRRITESSQISTASHWNLVQTPCNVTGANLGLASYNSSKSVCGSLDMEVSVQNLGSDPITSATLVVKEGGTTLGTQTWTGNLNTFQLDEVTFPNITTNNPGAVTVNITTNDAVSSDNVLNPGLTPAAPVSWTVTVEGKMDTYPTEFSWRMVDPNGVEVAQGGNYTVVNENANCSGSTPSSGGYAANATFTQEVELTELGCYKVEAFDSYGDGLLGTSTYFRVRNGNGQIVMNDLTYTCLSSNSLINDAVGIHEAATTIGTEIYPNPTSGMVNMVFNTAVGMVTVDVFNVLGERVMTRTLANNGVQTLDMNSLNNGLYYFNITADGNSTTHKVTLNK